MKTNLRMVLIFTLSALLLSAAGALAADVYEIDGVHSSADFKVRHIGISNVTGSFTDVAGTITVDTKKPEASSVEITIKTTSVNTHTDKRDEHLRSSDFFDVAKFPVMTFKSTKVKKISDTQYEVTGNFTLHGVTKSIKVTADLIGEGKGMKGETRAGYESSFKINRSDYGMAGFPVVVGDQVQITISVEAVKK